MATSGAIRVRGLRELNRAFARADRTLRKEKNDALKRAAEPVRADAQALAAANISRLGLEWSRMRVGVTTRVVYVAPAKRAVSRGGPSARPNLAPLLMDEAMLPGLERNRETVVRELDHMLASVGRAWER